MLTPELNLSGNLSRFTNHQKSCEQETYMPQLLLRLKGRITSIFPTIQPFDRLLFPWCQPAPFLPLIMLSLKFATLQLVRRARTTLKALWLWLLSLPSAVAPRLPSWPQISTRFAPAITPAVKEIESTSTSTNPAEQLGESMHLSLSIERPLACPTIEDDSRKVSRYARTIKSVPSQTTEEIPVGRVQKEIELQTEKAWLKAESWRVENGEVVCQKEFLPF